MAFLERIIIWIERVFDVVAALLMIVIMLIVVLDVSLRYLLHAPLVWAYDMIGLYLMVGVFFLSVSGTYAAHKHIGLDIVVQHLGPRGRRYAEIFTSVVSIPLFFFITKVGAERAYINFIHNDATSGLVAWPTWIASILVPLGIGLLLLRLIFRLAGQIASLATGRDVVENAPLITSQGSE